MKKKETIRSLWTPTAGMLTGARRVAMMLLTTLLLTMTAQTARSASRALTLSQFAIWYVNANAAPGGDGKNEGTAFQTLKEVLDCSEYANGDVIMIASGTYTGDKNIGLTIDKSLSFEKYLPPVYTQVEVVFDAQDQGNIWTVETGIDIDISDFTFKNGTITNYGTLTISKSLTLDNSTIKNYGTVQIADGQVLKYTDDGGQVHLLCGTLDADAINALANKDITFFGYGGHCGQDNPETTDVDESKNVMWCISPDDPATADIDESKVLTISGTGLMMYYNSIQNADATWSNGAPWKAFANDIEKVIIKDGITYVGSNTFAHCPNISSVTLPESGLYQIGPGAFADCTSLTSIDIPMSVNNIGDQAFAGCSNLETVSIGYGEAASFTIGTEVFPATTTIFVPKASLSGYLAATDWSTYQIAPAILKSIVTQDNFSNFFDESGNLQDNTSDELIFQGEFSELVSRITLDRSITITGDNAVLKNIAFIIAADDVTLQNMTLVATSNLGNLIDIAGDNAGIKNLSITYNGGDEGAVAINVAGDNVNILNNTISFESYVPDDSEFAIALKLTDCYNALVDGNSITTQLPCVYAYTYDEDYYIMGSDRVNPVRLKDCEGLVFKNNTINSTTNDYSADFPTIQAIQIIGCHNSVLDHNNISMIDEMTPAGMDIYLYGINFGYNKNVTFSNNNFNISTKGGKDAAGTAYAFQGVESVVKIIGNSITSISNGPNIGIYVASMYGGDSDLIIEDNFINVTGCASSLGSWALVSGIEIQNGDAKIHNNTIYTHNVNDYDEDAYMYGISYAQWMYGDRSFDIQNNTVYTEGKYAISVIDATDLNVEKNTLFAHELKGDDSVNPGSCANVNIEDNLSEGDLSWSIADGTLSITGKGAMTAAATNAYPWYNDCSVITTINIGEGITSIADNAFGSVSNINTYSNVTKVFIPSTVTSIGADAFKGCVSAMDVYCYADPAKLTWGDLGDDFKSDGSTICHVADANDWSRFSSVNVTFVDDLADVSIPYIDADGNTAYCTNFTVLTGSTDGVTLGSDGETTWYVVNSNVDYKQIKLVGNVNLILCDGQTMTAISGSVSAIIGDNRYNNSLTIYGQTAGTGTLKTFCGEGSAICSNAITINGGTVNAIGGDTTDDHGIFASGNVTINGGTVNAEGGDYFDISAGGNVIINGGKVSATGNSGGIMARGNIILGWTNNTDRIYASSFSAGGTISIADGKAFTDGANVYTSATPSATLEALTDVTLIPKKDISTCSATVPNQTLTYTYNGNGMNNNSIIYKFENANNSVEVATQVDAVVMDGSTTLTLGTDYEFGRVTLANGDEIPYTGSKVGDQCKVVINGIGDYAGTTTAEFKIIVPDASDDNWGDLTWAYHDGTLTISKKSNVTINVAMPDGNSYADFPWHNISSGIFTVTIGEGIIKVGNNAFAGTSNGYHYDNLATINLPSTLTTIGENAFAFCPGLTIDLSDIPDNITSTDIGLNAFSHVGKLTATLTALESGSSVERLSSVFAGYPVEVSFSRTFKENVASTLCLPYDFEPKGGTFYEFTSVNDAWTEVTMTSVNATSTTPLTAGKPYLFMPAADGPLDFTGIITNVANSYTAGTTTPDGSPWTFTGTYEEKRWDASNNPDGRIFGFATGQGYEGTAASQDASPGDFIRLNTGGIKPFRAYLEYTGSLQARTRGEGGLPETMTVRLVNANGEIQGIGEIRLSTGEVTFDSRAWYDLNGRRLDGKPSEKGIYINGGRKVVIK